MLEIASSEENATRTKIMYKSFLSHIQLKKYLAFLLENGLIKEFYKKGSDGKHKKAFYKPTDKGKRFLFLYNEINNSFSLEPAQKYLFP